MCTHEQFIHAVRDLAIQFATVDEGARWLYVGPTVSADDLARLKAAKLTYGRGQSGLRGVTQYNAWKHTAHSDLVEICALGEESWVQLAGTTIHELAHVLHAKGGHGKEWKAACEALGMRRAMAAGTVYRLAMFHPWLRMRLALMPKPSDGAPSSLRAGGKGAHVRVCSAGIGTKGGTSRGMGSGSRLRKYTCGHGQIIRASTDELHCTCNVCNTPFEIEEK